MLSRRRFIQASSLVSLSPLLPRIFASTALAAPAEPDARALVVIQLDGGNDGLNTVVPYADDEYGKSRDKLRLDPKDLHKLDDRVALHRSMKDAKSLFDEGRLCVVQCVGYPNPDRSHFRSMRIWQTTSFDDDQHDGYGWLGGALDQWATQRQNEAMANAIYVGDQAIPVALWGRRSSATALTSADDLKLALKISPTSPAAQPESDIAQFVSKQALSAYATADEFARQQASRQSSTAEYPDTALASQLKLVAQLLKGGARSRVFYAIQDGYDTHSAQVYTHSGLLRDYARALKSFLDDLKAANLDDRVVVLTFSEFGRRVKENDSHGTDHGAAGPVFLAGTPVKGGLLGEAPNLTDLDDGDLKMRIDFRRIYATLLDDWLGIDSKLVLGSPFEKVAILA